MRKLVFISLTLLLIVQPIKLIAQSDATIEETENWLNGYSHTLLMKKFDGERVNQYFFVKDGYISIARDYMEVVNSTSRFKTRMNFRMNFNNISKILVVPTDDYGGSRISFFGVLSFESRSFDYYMGKTSVNKYEQENQDFMMFMVAKDIDSAKRIMKALTRWVKLKNLNVKIDNVLDIENKF